MQPTLCSKCHKNIAVIFVSRIENGETKNEGLCLKCARSMGIKPIDDMMKRMGIPDEDLDNLTDEMMTAFNSGEGLEGLVPQDQGDNPDEEEDEGKTATFPFLNRLFGANNQGLRPPVRRTRAIRPAPAGRRRRKAARRSFWTTTAST